MRIPLIPKFGLALLLLLGSSAAAFADTIKITTDRALVWNKPNGVAVVITQLKRDETVEVVRKLNGWYEIIVPGNSMSTEVRIGYVSASQAVIDTVGPPSTYVQRATTVAPRPRPTKPGTSFFNKILVFAGNGDGTFTETENIASGGYSWKLVLGDVNNDGKLDVAQANGYDNNASILFGNGDGTLQPAQIYTLNGSGVGSSLGDLDGDGWLDWVVSSYTASEWYVMHNNGDGTFTRVGTIPAPMNASCASLYDFDNNGTLDMALADEVSDEILLMKNDGASTVLHADVAVALSGDPQQYTPGASLTYTLTITNGGPDPSNGTTIDDAFPSALSGVAWTCQASGGATCPPSGSGAIGTSVDLPSGGTVVFTATGTVAAGTTGTLHNQATATVDAPTIDPNGANNTAAIDTDPAPPSDVIFKNGFDPG